MTNIRLRGGPDPKKISGQFKFLPVKPTSKTEKKARFHNPLGQLGQLVDLFARKHQFLHRYSPIKQINERLYEKNKKEINKMNNKSKNVI